MVRISGLASGMDIDQMVKDLMKVERMPLDKLKQKQQTLEWQRDDYRSLNTLFFNFRQTLTNMKLTPAYRARSTVSTNDQFLTATASSAAAMSSYSISKVKQLATAATKVNTGKISSGTEKVDINQSIMSQAGKLSGLTWEQGVVESKSISVSEDGTELKFPLDGANLKDINNMNIKVDGKTYKLVTDPNAVLADNEVRVSVSDTGTDGVLTFKSLKKGSNVKIDYVADKKIEKTTISDQTTGFQLNHGAIVTDSNFSIVLNNKTFKLDENGTDLIEVDASGNPASSGLKLGTLDKETGKVTFSDAYKEELKKEAEEKRAAENLGEKDTVSFDVSTTYQQNYTSFKVATSTSQYPNGVEENFFVQGNDSLSKVMTNVNNSNVGVSLFYDSFSDQMTLTRTETGNFNGDETVQEISTSGNFIDTVLKFGGAAETGGTNAKFNINGLDTERTSNTFEMNGVTFTLKKTFDTAESVSIKNDSSKVFDNIKAFVDEYNKLIDTVNKKISEDRYRDYGPLTDEQREQLSDKQQEMWEEKAKSGLLKGDTMLSGALTQMRMSMYQPVDNANVASAFKQLAAIGIKTTANYLEGGKLEIDEAALKKAIEDDPTSVENLFRGTGDTTSSKGIVQRLYDDVSTTINKLNDRAGKAYSTNQQFTIGRNLDDVAKKITSFTDRLKQIEDRYYRQFSAMESAIQKSNNQMNYLLQQFSSGQ
ncbi:flagellar filament capping protein FliD [Heyndrickxia sporothermodurans]|uniref:flagellar filament capping protein FliD n=1 Tax=Heyndrickxia sporothermodurans TaxID=46224 RepID=UPI002E242BEA|nr:flagellar filament capping protein FliD [Heyndrickxia sporothermodurans]MED3650570.1 flagellar filament capping protein FliD [Heyndrickxia sporothermodurans]MED3653712.1 flagellar filament capping protein FliD [Heyndrickxia sporothermodurans]MED3697334.1 flagellar filament capping protein FliD [Heyndrickxia sporothermodurans]MED3780783.1 flagellar filament capping protein FliD [Heyndrickxia sporothermodurans]